MVGGLESPSSAGSKASRVSPWKLFISTRYFQEKSPENALYYQKLGRCHMDVGEYSKAVSDFVNAVLYKPLIDAGRSFLAEALFYSNQRDEAIRGQQILEYEKVFVCLKFWEHLVS